jgi:uncharacterized protein YfbU (UPF0304 family)
MRLTPVERLLLSNQFQILAALHPEEAERYEELSEILDRGYEALYDRAFEAQFEEPLTAADGQEVIDVLAMYEALQRAYDALPDKGGLPPEAVAFPGFDPRSEHQAGFAKFYCEADGGRFQTVRRLPPDFTSRRPMRARYHAMLHRWQECPDKVHLTAADLARIVAD